MDHEKVVLDGDDMRRTLVRIAHEIVERSDAPERLAIVGIHRRGAILARRIHALLLDLLEREIPIGDLYLAKGNIDAQQTDRPIDPEQRDDYLFEPVDEDRGAHGPFDEDAKDRSLAWNAAKASNVVLDLPLRALDRVARAVVRR